MTVDTMTVDTDSGPGEKFQGFPTFTLVFVVGVSVRQVPRDLGYIFACALDSLVCPGAIVSVVTEFDGAVNSVS